MTTSARLPSGMPVLVLAALVVAGIGVLPLTLVGATAVLLGNDSGGGRDWWTLLLLAPPVLELLGIVWLLTRRGRWPLVLAAAASLAVTGLVLGMAARVGQSVGVWPFLLVVCPLAAAVLAMTPAGGEWVAARRRGAAD
ncbi:hypothetical protein SAMN05660690_3407 [Geodermatophilus telluris]|uniref:Uncharacterized protein n=1 Tax=Geodermatophilus telluris TaxID=1190417 RepID=A0A1G6S115_9ACTN|nr:hypothetical protein [Geodermatophilus telluris]SDD10549.1 hypothetical protein SAMN05660690_3407 [Geodermatophilus telluris]